MDRAGLAAGERRHGGRAALRRLRRPRLCRTAREGFKRGILDLHKAFPDFHAVVEDLVVDEASQTVAVRWMARGTHQGPYLGVPATGRTIHFQGIEIIRVKDGLIAERWGEWDGLDLVEQLQAPA
jgi:steroid delta-isomerase-like uncharacterized protein